MSRELYAGLMSGTSLDGVDAVLLDFAGPRPKPLKHVHRAFAPALRAELLALNSQDGGELERSAVCANELARAYAAAITDLLAGASVDRRTLQAIGCHGQTVRHRPEAGYTLQIGNAALLAELTGLRVIADFRSRDVAAGGQGAPLAPAFHAVMFASTTENRIVLNLGGMANLSWLPADGRVAGFDTGPGNCLMDLWAQKHLGRALDENGAWAAGARADAALLGALLAEPYFSLPPPKSTGRDLFNEGWLDRRLPPAIDPRVVQATLLELTAQSVAQSIRLHFPGAQRLIACGGGVRNGALMARLGELLTPVPVESSAGHGIGPSQVEAAAFAWLARQAVRAKAGNVPAVTGARGPRILGAIYPP
ncbi:MAG: anhydro-N-acetylmuramic acid kinase [Betaproteobacteria bacterium]|nr:anhydro-N-acetylmuramic acid kinase [Betaproteobacteria bacterium]